MVSYSLSAHPAKALTGRYVIALALIACLAVMGQILIQINIIQQTSDTEILTLAGTNNTLNQQAITYAFASIYAPNDVLRQVNLNELAHALQQWPTIYSTLREGQLSPLPNSTNINFYFESIDTNHNVIINAGNCILRIYEHDSVSGDLQNPSDCRSIPENYAQSMLNNGWYFNRSMSNAVMRYEQEASERIQELRKIELSLLIATLIVLFLEALLIFRPAIRQVQTALSQLLVAQAALQNVNNELEARVTERTHALEVALADVRQSNQLKDEFLATMSHELRTPLNAIIGFLGLMAMGGSLDEKHSHMVQRCRANAERLLTLINDILDISRIESGRVQLTPSQIPVETFFHTIKNQMQSLAFAKHIRVEVEIEPSMPEHLFIDEDALTKITSNLLSNAIKFTEQGEVRMVCARQGNQWYLQVTDTGIGIPTHLQEVIFEKFRQVDGSYRRQHGGSGLGLAIVQQLCQSMGGNIQVQSILGQGSTFTVTLPIQLASINQLQKGILHA